MSINKTTDTIKEVKFDNSAQEKIKKTNGSKILRLISESFYDMKNKLIEDNIKEQDITRIYNDKLNDLDKQDSNSVKLVLLILQYRKNKIAIDKQNNVINTNAINSKNEVYSEICKIVGKNIGNEELIIKEAEKIAKLAFELLEEYKKQLKSEFIKGGKTLTHITSVSPQNILNGKILRSIDRLNQYEEEKGDWTFASSVSTEGNVYLARVHNGGMIRINEDTFVLGGSNISVKKNGDGSRVYLNSPGYIYKINPDNFTPVATIRFNSELQKFYFEFDKEWVCKNDIDINDRSQVVGIEEYTDITSVVERNQIICDLIGGQGREILKKAPNERLNYIKEAIKNGRLRYINDESGINVNDEILKEKLNLVEKNNPFGR